MKVPVGFDSGFRQGRLIFGPSSRQTTIALLGSLQVGSMNGAAVRAVPGPRYPPPSERWRSAISSRSASRYLRA